MPEDKRVDVRMSDDEFKELSRQAKEGKRTNPAQIKYLIEQEKRRKDDGR